MSFFQSLAAIGGVDMSLRIMQKNDTLTLQVMPGSGNSTTQPIIITGTPQQLDESFIDQIVPAVKEVGTLISNIEEVKKEAEKKLDDAKKANEKPAAKKAETKKAQAKTASKKKQPAVTEVSMFDNAAEESPVTEDESAAVSSEE